MINPGERYRDKFGTDITVDEVDEWFEVITVTRYGKKYRLPYEWWNRNVVERAS